MRQEQTAWLTVRVTETDVAGVDSRLLARMLVELSDSMLAAARLALGDRRKRRGPATKAELSLASLRISSVSEGSVVLEYDRPPGLPTPAPRLPGMETTNVGPEKVAGMVLDAARAVERELGIEPGEEALRRSVRRFLEVAAKVGRNCYLELQPPATGHRHVRIDLKTLSLATPSPAVDRQITLFGHVYMADVELGRQRLRIKLPNESDITMDIVPELRESLLKLLDQPVVLDVTERLSKGFIVARTVRNARLLPPKLDGADRPPRSLRELAAAQGLLSGPSPDYTKLATAVWPDADDVNEAAAFFANQRAESA